MMRDVNVFFGKAVRYSPCPVAYLGLFCFGGVPRLYSPCPVTYLGAIRSAGFRLPRGTLSHSLAGLLPCTRQRDSSLWNPRRFAANYALFSDIVKVKIAEFLQRRLFFLGGLIHQRLGGLRGIHAPDFPQIFGNIAFFIG